MIAIVASNELWPSPDLASNIFGIIIFAEASDQGIGIRISKSGQPASHLEAAAEEICRRVGVPIHHYGPRGVAENGLAGRKSVFLRDEMLVGDASKVFAFFSPAREMDGGTGHVVRVAMNAGVDVEAWSLDAQGEPFILGSLEQIEEEL